MTEALWLLDFYVGRPAIRYSQVILYLPINRPSDDWLPL